MASGHGSHSDQAPHPKFVEVAPRINNKTQVMQPPGNFLWVDYQDGKSQGREALRSKQAFIRTRYHRLRRENKLQQSRTCVRPFLPSPRLSDITVANNDDDDLSARQDLALPPSLEAGVLDGGPAPTVATNQNPNIYFQHYRIHSSRACFPLCSDAVSVWFWHKAVDDPPLMQIKLSISAYHRAAILQACGASAVVVQKQAQDALRLRGEAIKSLQQILQNPASIFSESTVFLISHLIVSEGMEGNIKAVEAHVGGMKRIIAATGGMDRLDHGTISMVYSCEIVRGMIKKSPPTVYMSAKFQNRVLKESAFFKAQTHFKRFAVLGTGFFNTSWSKDIHPMFKSIISSFQQLVRYYESLDTFVPEPMSVENDCLLFLVYRLLSLPHEYSLTPFEETLQLSIMVYSFIRIWTFRGMPCLEVLVKMLRESLDRSFFVLQSTASDLLFWILFTGSLASKGFKCHSWFLEYFTDAAERLSVEDWDSAVSILERCFFVHRPCDDPAKELWNSTFQTGTGTVIGLDD